MNNSNNFMKEKVSVETLQVCNRKYAQNCIDKIYILIFLII